MIDNVVIHTLNATDDGDNVNHTLDRTDDGDNAYHTLDAGDGCDGGKQDHHVQGEYGEYKVENAEPFDVHNRHRFKTKQLVFSAYHGKTVHITDQHVQQSLWNDATNPYLKYKPRKYTPKGPDIEQHAPIASMMIIYNFQNTLNHINI